MNVLNVVDCVLAQGVVGYGIRTFHVFQCQRALGHTPVAIVRSERPLIGNGSGEKTYSLQDSFRHRVACRLERLSYRLYRRVDRASLSGVVRHAARVERPDLIHCATPSDTFLAAVRVARKQGIPIVYEVRGFWKDSGVAQGGFTEDSADYRKAKDREASAVRSADVVVTLGREMKKEVIALGASEHRVFVARNGVDCQKFKPQQRDRELAANLGLSDHFVVGTASNVRTLEGLDSLILAASLLRDLPLKVLIVGDGTDRPRLERLARLLRLQDVVVFTGKVDFDAVQRYYSLFDAYALPRIRARVCELVLPLKPFEAAAMGIPVLASDLPAFREVVQDGRTGVFSPPDDAVALASAIRGLFDAGPEKRAEMGAAARKWAVENATWDRTADVYRQVYAAVMQGNSAAVSAPNGASNGR